MPIYEYQCQDCSYEFEKLQKMSDTALTDCPQCHASSLQKKISAAGFRLSGGGWYETDFKSGSKKNLAGDTDSSATPDKKTESSAAPKSDAKASTPAASTSNDK